MPAIKLSRDTLGSQGRACRTYKSHRREETQQFGQSLEVLGAALLGPDLRKLFQGPG